MLLSSESTSKIYGSVSSGEILRALFQDDCNAVFYTREYPGGNSCDSSTSQGGAGAAKVSAVN